MDNMKSYEVKWHASGLNGAFRAQVVASELTRAKELWQEYIASNKDVEFYWRKAEKGVKNHYGGYITWTEKGYCDKETGCYDLGFDAWNGSSDHLWD